MTYMLCILLLLSLSACNESIRNPSAVDEIALLKALPSNVIGEISLQYYGAGRDSEFGTIYDNGEEVIFIFGADGSLRSTEEEIEIDDAYEIINQKFVWIDEEEDIEYSLSLNDNGVGKLEVNNIDGTLIYGQFSIKVDSIESDSSSNTITITEESASESLLPSTVTEKGEYTFKFTDVQEGFEIGLLDEGDIYYLAFFSTGQLQIRSLASAGDRVVEIDDFKVRGDEFVWEDPNNQLEYVLSLTPEDAVDRVEINDLSENYYGTFELIEVE